MGAALAIYSALTYPKVSDIREECRLNNILISFETHLVN